MKKLDKLRLINWHLFTNTTTNIGIICISVFFMQSYNLGPAETNPPQSYINFNDPQIYILH